MTLNHRILRLVVAFAVGLLAALGSYLWITDTERSSRRTAEEGVVLAAREILRESVGAADIEISDPLERIRAAGKVYIFPTETGWEVSGHYRRQEEQTWHDFLMTLDAEARLVNLRVNDDDPDLAGREPRISVAE